MRSMTHVVASMVDLPGSPITVPSRLVSGRWNGSSPIFGTSKPTTPKVRFGRFSNNPTTDTLRGHHARVNPDLLLSAEQSRRDFRHRARGFESRATIVFGPFPYA